MEGIRQMRNYFGGANIYLKAAGWSLFALICFVPILVTLLQPEIRSIWWTNIIVALISCGILYALGRWGGLWKAWRDVFSGQTRLLGRLRRGWVKEITHDGPGGGPGWAHDEFRLNVEGQTFKVQRELFCWLQKGDEVAVYYWPHSRTVAKIEKLTAQDLARVFPTLEIAIAQPVRMRSYEQHLRSGLAYCKQAEWEKAEAEFKAALSLNPDSAEALAWLGMAYHELGEYDEAIEHLSRAISIEPNNEKFLVWLAYAYLDSTSFPDHVGKIRSLLEMVLRHSKAYVPLHLIYWLCCVERGETSVAIESMQEYLAEPKLKGKRYVKKLLTALEQEADKFMDVWKMEKPW